MTTTTFNLSRSRQRASSGAGASANLDALSGAEQGAPGRLLSGRLRIERFIGKGSMGMVLEARHLELDTRVAVKAILPHMQAVPGMVALFAREAKAAVGIRSEHVAQVFDVGTDEELGPYIVMEYLEGCDLRALLDREGRLPAAQAIDYILQACEALAVAHARGVIHRDIKPGNLFLTRQGELEIVKLLDFGVSKAALRGRLFGGELSGEEAADLMGTPLYMSPEQIHAPERVDQRSDIWALGAVLYELVTGHSVFPGSAPLPELLSRICHAAPRPLAEYCSGLLPLQAVIDQCLDRNPARRFQNVAELAYALFPLASARSQLHAHRAASILATPCAAAVAQMSAAIAPRAQPALPSSQLSQRRSLSATRWLPHCLLLATLLGSGALPNAGEGAERLASLERDPPRGSGPGVDDAGLSLAAAPGSQPVIVESRSSSTLRARQGYSEARALPRPELEERLAVPLAMQVASAQVTAQPTAGDSPAAARRHAAQATKPSGLAPVPGTPAAPKAPPSPERPRLRLVEDSAPRHVASRS